MSYLWHVSDEVVGIGDFGRLFDLLPCSILRPKGDILPDAGPKQDGILTDHSDLPPQPSHVQLANIDATQKYLKIWLRPQIWYCHNHYIMTARIGGFTTCFIYMSVFLFWLTIPEVTCVIIIQYGDLTKTMFSVRINKE